MVDHVPKSHIELFLGLFEQNFLMFQSVTELRSEGSKGRELDD